MYASMSHWPDRPREIKTITPKIHPEGGHGVSVTLDGTETISITSTDPVFLEELEAAVRSAREHMERVNLRVAS